MCFKTVPPWSTQPGSPQSLSVPGLRASPSRGSEPLRPGLYLFTPQIRRYAVGSGAISSSTSHRPGSALRPFLSWLLYFDFIVSEIVFNLIICMQLIATDQKNQVAFMCSMEVQPLVCRLHLPLSIRNLCLSCQVLPCWVLVVACLTCSV